MSRTELINQAKMLVKPSAEAYAEYNDKQEILVKQVDQEMQNREDLLRLIGEDNFEMMKNNHANHARFMTSMFFSYHPEVFVETIIWVFRAYRAHGFHTTYWAAQLNAWMQAIASNLSDNAQKEIMPFYNWLVINIPLFTLLSNEDVAGDPLTIKH